MNSIFYKENIEITRIKINDDIVEDDAGITNKFYCYFVESIVELNENIPVIPFVDLRFEFRSVSITHLKSSLNWFKNDLTDRKQVPLCPK